MFQVSYFKNCFCEKETGVSTKIQHSIHIKVSGCEREISTYSQGRMICSIYSAYNIYILPKVFPENLFFFLKPLEQFIFQRKSTASLGAFLLPTETAQRKLGIKGWNKSLREIILPKFKIKKTQKVLETEKDSRNPSFSHSILRILRIGSRIYLIFRIFCYFSLRGLMFHQNFKFLIYAYFDRFGNIKKHNLVFKRTQQFNQPQLL